MRKGVIQATFVKLEQIETEIKKWESELQNIRKQNAILRILF